MEFYQFHPTGINGLGILITEAVRGEGGILRNRAGDRFMEHYSPTLLDLAPRDIVSRSVQTEVRAGRGMRGDRKIDDYVHLDATHLGKETLSAKLPDITDFCQTYLGIDPSEQPIPVLPTAHYAMGGIPTNLDGQVLRDSAGTIVEGLYAAGECACVSVHGANRLGTNSLLDLVVFGRRAGIHIGDYVGQADRPSVKAQAVEEARIWLHRLTEPSTGDRSGDIEDEMKTVMMEKVGIYRNDRDMRDAVASIQRLRRRYEALRPQNHATNFNSDLLEFIELRNLLDLSLITAVSALQRQESRGAHSREDFPERDDENWLRHSLAYLEGDTVRLDYKPVDVSIWEPKPRSY
jgi:succinate dehydrogenase / fumarate reductase flavoprotein subunit